MICTHWLGHKYKAVFDKSEPINSIGLRRIYNDDNIADALETMRRKTYVCSVCARCGDIVDGRKQIT